MNLYAVCFNTAHDDYPDDFWIEFYWGIDSDHAEQLATEANEYCAVVCIGMVPPEYVSSVSDLPERKHV